MDVLLRRTGCFVLDVLARTLFLWSVVLSVGGLGTGCQSLPVTPGTTTPSITPQLEPEPEHQVYIEDEGCQLTVWDTTRVHRGVHQVNARCKEGLVTWRSPYGAVRLTLGGGAALGGRGHVQGSTTPSQGIELCFLAKSNFTTTKISLETQDSPVATTPLQPLVTLTPEAPRTRNEVCVRSAQDHVTLYIEADLDLNAYTIGHVDVEYSLDWLQKTSPSNPDPEAECRPCTESELLTAVCTADFVVAGRIDSVEDPEEIPDSVIRIAVERVHRQIENHFSLKGGVTDKLDKFSSKGGGNEYLPEKLNQDKASLASSSLSQNSVLVNNGYSTNAILVPRVCGVRPGKADPRENFLLTGRFRLGRAVLGCAPRLQDFRLKWRQAVAQGTNPCTVNWEGL